MKKVAAALVLVLASLALVACGSSSSPTTSTTSDAGKRAAAGGGAKTAARRRQAPQPLEARNRPERPARLQATSKPRRRPGNVTIDFNNPQALGHDVAIEGSSGKIVGKTELVERRLDLDPVNLKPGHLPLLLLGPRPPRSGHGRHPDRQVRAAEFGSGGRGSTVPPRGMDRRVPRADDLTLDRAAEAQTEARRDGRARSATEGGRTSAQARGSTAADHRDPCYYYVVRSIGERSTDPALLVLTSLADGPKHGYAITRDIEQLAGVRLGPGTLYGALSRLEGKGLIEALPAEDRRRPYRLTGAGAAALEEQLRSIGRVATSGLARLRCAEDLG